MIKKTVARLIWLIGSVTVRKASETTADAIIVKAPVRTCARKNGEREEETISSKLGKASRYTNQAHGVQIGSSTVASGWASSHAERA